MKKFTYHVVDMHYLEFQKVFSESNIILNKKDILSKRMNE